MSTERNLRVAFPELPNVKPKTIRANGADDVYLITKSYAVEFERKYQEDMRLVAQESMKPRDLSSTPFDAWYERTRRWLKEDRNSLQEYTLAEEDLLEECPVYQNFDKTAKVIHLILVTNEVLDDLDEPGELLTLAKTFQHQRTGFLEAYDFASPSATVNSPEALEKASRYIFYGRPFEQQGLQPALYNPAIAQLMHELETLETAYPHPSLKELEKSMTFLVACNAFCPDQEARMDRILETEFFQYFSADTEFGTMWTVIKEVKNESGLDGDAFTHAILSYVHQAARRKKLLQKSHAPAIIIGIAANVLTIGAAIFTDAVYVSTLLTMSLSLGNFPDRKIIEVARIASAVATASDGLQKHYEDVLKGPRHQYPFSPNPTPIEGVLPKVRYTGKINKSQGRVEELCAPKLRNSALFTAELDLDGETRKVVVKFTDTYCSEAHQLLADNDLAPTLHLCTKLKGGFIMVIMDQILDSERMMEVLNTESRPMKIHEQATRAVQLLHEKNLVFGDLRPPNMLYNEQTGQLQLVDFDMAGKDGEARYPATLNRMDIWPPSIMRGGLMMKQHDLEWLDILKRLIRSDLKNGVALVHRKMNMTQVVLSINHAKAAARTSMIV